MFDSLAPHQNIALVGAQGTIGQALRKELEARHPHLTYITLGRDPALCDIALDYENPGSIERAAQEIQEKHKSLSGLVVATGALHTAQGGPEKAIKELSAAKMATAYQINAIGPALVATHFLPLFARKSPGLMAFLSARVGSISDNGLGGWTSYRCSKAALNMFVKCLSIELGRSHPLVQAVALHPGTVKSPLSDPFTKNMPPEKLFSPAHAATCLITTLDNLPEDASGKCFAYDGQEIMP